jgi:hypothetical protein
VNPLLRHFAGLLLVAVTALSCSARTLEFAAANVRCEIPDDWIIQQRKGILLFATSPYGTRSFMITYHFTPTSVDLDDPRFNDEVEAGIESVAGSTVIGSGTVMMHDVRFRYFDVQNATGEITRNRHVIDFLGNAHCYGFGVSKDGDDPMKDDELVGILQSCNFINAPRPHTGLLTFWNAFQPLDVQNYSTSGRIGYAANTCFEIAVISLGPLVFLLGLTFLFYRWLYRDGLWKRKQVAS